MRAATETVPTVNPSMITGSAADPAPLAAQLRERDPVCWLAGLDTWLVTRHDDVRMLFADQRMTADPRSYERYQPPADARSARWLVEMPYRAAVGGSQSLGRSLISAALTPRAIARVEQCIRDVVEQHAAPLRGRTGTIDLMADFTSPASTAVLGRLLGVPPKGEDDAKFGQLARAAARTIRPLLSEAGRLETERAAAEICEYVLALVADRRARPAEDLISDLIRAADADAPATDEEIASVVAGLVSAGTGTTGTACARALRTLLRHPAELALLRAKRSLLPNAVNELLRYDSGIVVMPRYVVEDFELRGRSLRRGQLVLLGILGANRDPMVFPEPDRVDLERDTSAALSFGFGTHFCIGANIARTELRLMIASALDFLPRDARLLEDQVEWSAKGLMSQIRSLPVDFGKPADRGATDELEATAVSATVEI